MTTPSLDALLKIADEATPGPWCIESCGEKGDGSNIIGVVFGPKDINAERPLSGWLEDCDEDGNFIEYYRDEEIAECGHRNRNSAANATHIARFHPTVAKALVKVAMAAKALHNGCVALDREQAILPQQMQATRKALTDLATAQAEKEGKP